MNSFEHPLRILFVEDLPTDYELAERQIRHEGIEFISRRVDTRQAFLSALDEFKPDLVISDYSMPEFNGLEALVLAQEYSTSLPFIVLTGALNEDTAVVCMKAGAADYVIKEHMNRLPFAIKEALSHQKSKEERTRAEDNASFLSQRLQRYVQASPVVMFAFDIVEEKFFIKWVSENVSRVLGYSAEDVLAPDWWNSNLDQEDLAITIKAEQDWIKKGRNLLTQEFRFQRKDGGRIWVHEVARILSDENQGPIEAIAAWTDISARKETEEQLSTQIEALNAAANAIMITDPDGNIEWANPSFSALTGFALDETAGKNLRDLVKSGFQDPSFYKALWDTILDGQVWRGEIINRRKDGSIYTEEETITPVRDAQNRIKHFIAIKQDATRRKEAESAQKRHLQHQEMLVSLARALGATPDLSSVYQTTHKFIQKLVDCPNFGIFFFDPGQELLIPAYLVAGLIPLDITHSPPLKYSPGNLSDGRSQAIATQKPMIVDGLGQKGAALSGEFTLELQSALFIPMIVEGQIIGLLDMQSPLLKVYTPEDGEWLSVAANQVGLAIQNGRLFSQVRQRLSELAALHEVDSTITEHLGLQKTLDVALEQIMSQLKVDAADFLLLDVQKQTLCYANGRGFKTRAAEITQLNLGNGLASVVVLEKRKVQILDPERDHPGIIATETWAQENFVAYVGVPLIMNNEVKGVIEVYNRSIISPSPDWFRFLESLAGQVAIAIDNTQLFDGMQAANASLLQAYDATIEGWSHALDLRDKETEGHTLRVTELTLRLAREIGLGEGSMDHIRRGALLHDIGKMGVPDQILYKPGPLTAEEWVIMKKHPDFAHDMLKTIDYLRPALDIPYSHHEKWDGTGYPQGLKGEEIPLVSRIFAIVDVWDALTSDRPYRLAWTEEAAIQHLKEQSGTHFDPQLMEKFLRFYEKGGVQWKANIKRNAY